MATIQGVYVALFGRPADPTGLAYFNTVTNNGANLNAIGNLAASPEYQARFTGQNNIQIINSIYQSLFGRDADLTGLTFFSNALANGSLNINNIAIAILDGAQGNDRTVSNNKIAAADLYTKALDTGSEVVAYSGLAAAAQGRAFISGVTTTVPTAAAVDTAVAAMVTTSQGGGTGATGVTIALASGTDNVNPNSTESKFKSTENNDTIIAGTNLANTNVIDAGNGSDTLTASLADSATAVAPILKSVETVTLTTAATGTVGTGFAFSGANATGVTTLNVKSLVLDNGVSAALTNITKSTLVNVDTVNAETTEAASVTIGYQSATGTTDAATVALSKVGTDATNNGAVTVTATGIENLTLQSNGSSATDTNKITLDVTDAVSVKFTGANGLTVTDSGTLTNVKAFDASGMTGALDLTLSGAHTAGTTIATGSAADKVTLTASSNQDVLVYSSASQSTIAKMDSITGFDAVSEDKIDLKAFNLGSTATVAATTLDSTGSDVPSMFSGTNKIVFNDTSKVLYVDVNGDGNFNATSDLAIKLVGVSATDLDKADFILA